MGISLNDIQPMEITDFHDWMDAAEALILHDEMRAIQAHNGGAERFKKIQTEQLFLFGENPFKPNEDEIKKNWEARKKAYEERKRLKESGQNDSGKTNS